MLRNLSLKTRKKGKTFLKMANMPNNATNEPNSVADIVRGGGLKLDKLKNVNSSAY